MVFPIPPSDSLYKTITFTCGFLLFAILFAAVTCHFTAEREALTFSVMFRKAITSYEVWRGELPPIAKRYENHSNYYHDFDNRVKEAKQQGPMSAEQEARFDREAKSLDNAKSEIDKDFKAHMLRAEATDNAKAEALAQEQRMKNANSWQSFSFVGALISLPICLLGLAYGVYSWYLKEQRHKDTNLESEARKNKPLPPLGKKRKGK